MNLEERYEDEFDGCPARATARVVALEERLNHMKDHLEGVLTALYGDESVEQLEWHLEEVLDSVGLKIPSQEPTVEKKSVKLRNVMRDLIEAQNKFLQGGLA